MAIPRRSAAEIDALLADALAAAPHDVDREDSWFFVYGSMLETPPFKATERRVAVIRGLARRFCLADPLLRGTEAQPGLTLGLDVGEQCVGLAWRLSHRSARRDIAAFWPGEMELPLYVARWLMIALDGAGAAPALVLVADPVGPLFERGLCPDAIVTRIATCVGSKGSNADYLFEAAGGLARAGIPDPDLDRLARAVKARLGQSDPGAR